MIITVDRDYFLCEHMSHDLLISVIQLGNRAASQADKTDTGEANQVTLMASIARPSHRCRVQGATARNSRVEFSEKVLP